MTAILSLLAVLGVIAALGAHVTGPVNGVTAHWPPRRHRSRAQATIDYHAKCSRLERPVNRAHG